MIWSAVVGLSLAAGVWLQEPRQAQVDRYSRQAEEALARKDMDTAAGALEKLVNLTPKAAEVHANLGMVYYAQNRFAQAAQAFERALKLNSNLPNTSLMLGICFAELGRHKEALTLLEPTFKKPPSRETGRLVGLELLRVYNGLKQHGKAVVVSEDLLERYPDDPEVLYHISRLYGDRALQLMTRLVEVAPDSVWVRMARAEVHENQKHYDLAVQEYQGVLKRAPRMPGVHFRLGRVLLVSSTGPKNTDEAVRMFEEELAIDPQNSNAEYEIGEICRQRGQLDAAKEHFSRAIQFHPEFEDAQIALGRTLMNLKKADEALPHFQAAVRLGPENEVPHFLLARAYRELGDNEKYREELEFYQTLQTRRKNSHVEQSFFSSAAPEVTRQTLDSEHSD